HRGPPPPDARAARRATPDQGQLGVPLRPPGARRGGDGGRAVHVRAAHGGGSAARRGAALDRPLPAPQHGPQHAEGRPRLRAEARREPVQARLRRLDRQPRRRWGERRRARLGGRAGRQRLLARAPDRGRDPHESRRPRRRVEGGVDAHGTTHERVFEVAGDPKNGADVDPATCTPRGAGSRELCALWRDPTFRRRERAFYYARVLENPTCRWSTRVCKAAGVDPLSEDCAVDAVLAGAAFADCCLGPGNDPFMDPLVQERAWPSPIWYRPEAIARLGAKVRYGAQPGTDRLAMRLALGSVPKDLDPKRTDLELRVSDDDDILVLTIPAGTLVRAGRGRCGLPGPTGAVVGAAHGPRRRRGV